VADVEIIRLDLARTEEECGDNALGRVRRAVADLAVGGVLEVSSSIAEHAFMVRAWTAKSGIEVVEERHEGAVTRFVLRPSAATQT